MAIIRLNITSSVQIHQTDATVLRGSKKNVIHLTFWLLSESSGVSSGWDFRTPAIPKMCCSGKGMLTSRGEGRGAQQEHRCCGKGTEPLFPTYTAIL